MADDDSQEIMTDPSTQDRPAKSSDPNVLTPMVVKPPPPGENAPRISEEDEGKPEGYIAGVTQEYTPEEKMRIAMEQTRSAYDSIDRLHARTAPMWERYRNALQQDQDSLQASGEQRIPPPPASSQQKQGWLGAVTQFLAVAIPIAMLFGLRGNGFAKGAMMSALGSFMTNYAKGRDQAAKNAWTDWKEQVAAIKASNQERHQLYRDTLADRRLGLEDQFKMINSYSQEFHDPIMARASRMRDMRAIVKHLENQSKASDRFARGADKMAKEHPPRDWPEYRQYILDKTDRKVDPDTDWMAADKIMKYSDWHEKEETTADRTRRHKEEESQPNEPSSDDVHKLFE